MRSFTAYIFDLDGVLCHTDKFHFAAWAALAKNLDLPFDASVNDRLRGVSRMESLDIVLGEKKDAFTAEQKKSFADEKNAIYRGYLQTMTPADLDEDVRSTLLKLRADGHKLAVGSSSKNAPLILERIGLGSFFDAVAAKRNTSGSGLEWVICVPSATASKKLPSPMRSRISGAFLLDDPTASL